MKAETVIRVAISSFIFVLLGVVTMGWQWAARNLAAGPLLAGRVVLALSAVAGIVGLVALWRPRPHA